MVHQGYLNRPVYNFVLLYHSAAILVSKRGWPGIKISKLAFLSAIMTNVAIVLKIYRTLIFRVISRNESARHP